MIGRWLQYAKNLPGWRSKEKYLLMSCDDFGAVRLADATAREYLVGKGLPMDLFPFDRYEHWRVLRICRRCAKRCCR
ncbi:MAG: hypothetical protein ACK448_02380 [Bacteroidota bacterium]